MHPRNTLLTNWERAALQDYLYQLNSGREGDGVYRDRALLAAWLHLNSLCCQSGSAYEPSAPCLESRLYALFAE